MGPDEGAAPPEAGPGLRGRVGRGLGCRGSPEAGLFPGRAPCRVQPSAQLRGPVRPQAPHLALEGKGAPRTPRVVGAFHRGRPTGRAASPRGWEPQVMPPGRGAADRTHAALSSERSRKTWPANPPFRTSHLYPPQLCSPAEPGGRRACFQGTSVPRTATVGFAPASGAARAGDRGFRADSAPPPPPAEKTQPPGAPERKGSASEPPRWAGTLLPEVKGTAHPLLEGPWL